MIEFYTFFQHTLIHFRQKKFGFLMDFLPSANLADFKPNLACPLCIHPSLISPLSPPGIVSARLIYCHPIHPPQTMNAIFCWFSAENGT